MEVKLNGRPSAHRERSSEGFSAILSVKGMLCQAYENCE